MVLRSTIVEKARAHAQLLVAVFSIAAREPRDTLIISVRRGLRVACGARDAQEGGA